MVVFGDDGGGKRRPLKRDIHCALLTFRCTHGAMAIKQPVSRRAAVTTRPNRPSANVQSCPVLSPSVDHWDTVPTRLCAVLSITTAAAAAAPLSTPFSPPTTTTTTTFIFSYFFLFSFGSCGRLSWLNCQLSSAC